MRISIYPLIDLLVLLGSLSCKNTSTDSIAELKATQKKRLVIDTEKKYIQLQTSNDCMLGFIIKVYADLQNDRIFVLSDFNIFIFSGKGEFITKMKQGKGPDEIIQIPSFTVDTKNKIIYAIDMSRDIVSIDYNGRVNKRMSLDGFASSNITLVDEGNLLLFRNFVGSKEHFFVGKYCLQEKMITEKYIHSSESPYPLNTMLSGLNFSRYNGNVHFYTSNIFNIYEFQGSNFIPKVSFDLSDKTVPSRYTSRYEDGQGRKLFRDEMKSKGYAPFLMYAFPFNDYYFVSIDDDEFGVFSINMNNLFDIYYNETIASCFDLPATRSLRMPTGLQENAVIFTCNPMDFFEHEPEAKQKTIEIGGESIAVNYTDNPIVIIVMNTYSL